jgi:hypothetical protein
VLCSAVAAGCGSSVGATPADEVAAALQDRVAKGEPLELLPNLHTMKDGEVHAVEDAAGGLVLVRVVAARLAPLNEAAAAPHIEKFLRARRAREAFARETKRLRHEARIEYPARVK